MRGVLTALGLQDAKVAGENGTEYMINMVSWKGSRSLYRLVVNDKTKALEISPTKPMSPGRASLSNTAVLLADIVAVDVGKGAGASGGRRLSLLGGDTNDKTFVSITTAGKKTIEFEMRFPEERDQLNAYLTKEAPALRPLTMG